MKKIIALVLALVLLTTLFVSCNKKDNTDTDTTEERSNTETNFVLIDIKGFGEIVVELYPDVAPVTVANFKKLVSEKFYDGLTFHRIYEGFMIQGGDPDGNGSGGSSERIFGEFAANGFANNLSHTRGVISMARSDDMNSASSQFFIMHVDYTGLDGLYAAFGKVVRGLDVLDAVATVETTYNMWGEKSVPLEPVVINSIYFVNPNN